MDKTAEIFVLYCKHCTLSCFSAQVPGIVREVWVWSPQLPDMISAKNKHVCRTHTNLKLSSKLRSEEAAADAAVTASRDLVTWA